MAVDYSAGFEDHFNRQLSLYSDSDRAAAAKALVEDLAEGSGLNTVNLERGPQAFIVYVNIQDGTYAIDTEWQTNPSAVDDPGPGVASGVIPSDDTFPLPAEEAPAED